MRMLKLVALSTVLATGVFGLTLIASSAYAEDSYWQGAPNATGPDAAEQGEGAPTTIGPSESSRWRADITNIDSRSGSDSSSTTGNGYGLGPGTNGPSSIDNGK